MTIKKACIFIPGFKGSRLVNTENQRTEWLTKRKLFFSGQTLMQYQPDLNNMQHSKLHSTEIIDEFTLIPKLYKKDFYRSCFLYLREHLDQEFEFIPFHYDWRIDLYEIIAQLDKLIKQLIKKGIQQITLFGHSMGGLIASYYCRYGNSLADEPLGEFENLHTIKKLIIAGTPFHGATRLLHDIHHGSKALFNKKILSPETIATFDSVYYLLPAPWDNIFISNNQKSLDLSLYNADTWIDHSLGIYATSLNADNFKPFLEKKLLKTKRFFDNLHSPLTGTINHPISVLKIYSNTHKTLSKLALTPYKNSSKVKFIASELGDGTITNTSMTLPEWFSEFNVVEHRVKEQHVNLLASTHTQNLLLDFIHS